MEPNELRAMVDVYSAYSASKEKFIDRNFATNRYYLAMSIFLLLITLVIHALTPSIFLMTTVSAIGIVTSVLWWINLDSYQFLIKIKYANVLEVMEEKLPAKPCQDEYKATQETKKRKGAIVFSDLQKGFAVLVLLIFASIFFANIAKTIMEAIYGDNSIAIPETKTEIIVPDEK